MTVFSRFAVVWLCFMLSCDSRNKLVVEEGASSPSTMQLASGRSSESQPSFDRKVIRRGEVSFQTGKVADTREALAKQVLELKGYIEMEHTSEFQDRIQFRMTIRVPAENFDLLVEKAIQYAEKLDSKNIGTEDVTEEFIDVEARIRTKKELERRYLELLTKAMKVEEVLAIERELGTLRSDIESIEGRFRYLKDRVAQSSLDVVFYELKGSSFGFVSRVGEALRSGWSSLLDFLVLLVKIWPFLVLFGVGFYLYRRLRSK